MEKSNFGSFWAILVKLNYIFHLQDEMRKDKVEEVVEELRDQREKMVITLSHFKRKCDEI